MLTPAPPTMQAHLLCVAWGDGPAVASTTQPKVQLSPGPGVAVGVLQQQALVAGQQVGVVVLHQAAHAHEQDLALQVEFRVLRGKGDKCQGARPAWPSLRNGTVSYDNSHICSCCPVLPPCLPPPSSSLTPGSAQRMQPGYINKPRMEG